MNFFGFIDLLYFIRLAFFANCTFLFLTTGSDIPVVLAFIWAFSIAVDECLANIIVFAKLGEKPRKFVRYLKKFMYSFFMLFTYNYAVKLQTIELFGSGIILDVNFFILAYFKFITNISIITVAISYSLIIVDTIGNGFVKRYFDDINIKITRLLELVATTAAGLGLPGARNGINREDTLTAIQINKIAPHRCAAKFNNTVSIQDVCSICLEDINRKELFRVLPCCKKAFHTHCIDRWLLVSSTKCTNCSRNLLDFVNAPAAQEAPVAMAVLVPAA
jgi:hypothetical protein